MIKERLTFKCWNCQREFSLYIEEETEPKLMKECPYCGETCVVDLNPYRDNVDGVFRGSSTNQDGPEHTFTFPDIIPTSEPEDAAA